MALPLRDRRAPRKRPLMFPQGFFGSFLGDQGECPDCKGSGTLMLIFRCQGCRGAGRRKSVCGYCGGTGRGWFFRCGDCGGTGRV